MRVVGITDIGLHRKRNEDHYFIDEARNLFVVCDGMGGHKGGDVASQLAVDTIQRCMLNTETDELSTALHQAVEKVNQAVYEKGKSDQSLYEMGTTLTAAVINDGKIFVAHVGDSSLFLLKAGKLIKITRDHTLAEQMLNDGLLKPEDMQSNGYNHVLTRAVGVENQVEVDIYQEEIQPGDWILLCTDGLTDLVDKEEVLKFLCSAQSPEKTAKELLDLALARGGYDNITIVLICV
jgi:serine/threonine protein phosphatase PrpC